MEGKGTGSVDFWLSRLGETTARNGETWFRAFMRWKARHGGRFKEYTPDELVEYQQSSDNGTKWDILNMVQVYVNSKDNVRTQTKDNYYRNIRSFFLHNRAELPADKSFIIRGDKPKVRGKLTIEIVRDMVVHSRQPYKTMFLSMFMGGMGLGEVLWWSDHGLEETVAQLEAGARVVKIDLPGRKKTKFEKPFYTFIGGDAVTLLREWMRERPQDAESVFTNQYRRPVRRDSLWLYWRNHLERLGVIEQKGSSTGNRYGYGSHEMRDLFRSQWEKSPAKGVVAEYMMGHSIDPLNYNKSFTDVEFYRREYVKALPKLNIITGKRPYGLVDEDEVRKLRETVRELEEKLDVAEATSQDDDLQRQLTELKLKDEEKQRTLDKVIPIVRDFEKLIDETKKLRAKSSEEEG